MFKSMPNINKKFYVKVKAKLDNRRQCKWIDGFETTLEGLVKKEPPLDLLEIFRQNFDLIKTQYMILCTEIEW